MYKEDMTNTLAMNGANDDECAITGGGILCVGRLIDCFVDSREMGRS